MRAKEGAVLFDKILFEDGMVAVTVGEKGNWTMFKPAHQLGPGDLVGTRRIAKAGEAFRISVGLEPEPGGTPMEMQTFLESRVLREYVAEWHSSAIDELAKLNVDWAEFGGVDDEQLARLGPSINQATQAMKSAAKGGELDLFEVEFASKALAQDATVAAHLGAAINVTSLFSTMIESLATEPEATGRDALALLVPNLDKLTWEDVARFREHPGSVDARGKLREFEERAFNQAPGDTRDHLLKVSMSITDDLMAALEETKVEVWKAIGGEATKSAISFLPIVGQMISPASGVAQALGERAEQRAAWYFALMELRA